MACISNTTTNKLSMREAALLAFHCMDLTSLNDDDTSERIVELCQKARQKDYGHVAAICIYPDWIETARKQLAQHKDAISIATVVNFPLGNDTVAQAVAETERAIQRGAHEVDVVFPYKALLAGNEQTGYDLVEACKVACSKAPTSVLLKVIIESGELKSGILIEKASQISIQAGANFIKTSTGKVPVNATLEAAEIMLKCIQKSGKPVGFKAAGGVRTVADAKQYLELAQSILGPAWVTPSNFRFGASGLLSNILEVLSGGEEPAAVCTSSTGSVQY